MLDLLLAAALMQAGDPCQAVPEGSTARSCPPWRTLAGDTGHTTFINPGSVVRGDGGFGITMRIIYSEDQEYRVRSALVRYRFNCLARTSVAVHVTLFDAAGVGLGDRDIQGRTPRVEVPGTPSAALLDEFCPARG